jgi:hypothetical protein
MYTLTAIATLMLTLDGMIEYNFLKQGVGTLLFILVLYTYSLIVAHKTLWTILWDYVEKWGWNGNK